ARRVLGPRHPAAIRRDLPCPCLVGQGDGRGPGWEDRSPPHHLPHAVAGGCAGRLRAVRVTPCDEGGAQAVRGGHEARAPGAAAARVVYGDPEPNGLASMLGGLLEANLAAHPERVGLLDRRATFAIRVPDVDVAVSIRLTPGLVTVRNGIIGRPDIVVEADSETLMGLSTVPLRFGLPDI